MSLDQIANIVEILGVLAIVSGIVLGLGQLRQHRAQRQDLAIMELARSFEDAEFTDAFLLLSSLTPGSSLDSMRSMESKYELAATRVGMKFETVGLLVHRGFIPMDAVEDLVGDAALTLWERLEVWIREMRVANSHDCFLEWYEWLVNQLASRRAGKRIPAFEKYR